MQNALDATASLHARWSPLEQFFGEAVILGLGSRVAAVPIPQRGAVDEHLGISLNHWSVFHFSWNNRPAGLKDGQIGSIQPAGRSCSTHLKHTQIIGASVVCADGIKDIWSEIVAWVPSNLTIRYRNAVRVMYIDLIDPDCPSLPGKAQISLILLNDEVISMGGKFSIPVITARLEEIWRASKRGVIRL